jgi:hypothetical protein
VAKKQKTKTKTTTTDVYLYEMLLPLGTHSMGGIERHVQKETFPLYQHINDSFFFFPPFPIYIFQLPFM